jgi:hypothetical protein
MATTLNVIKTITIRGTSEGVTQLEKDLGALAGQMDDVTIASGKQEKAMLSAENALKKLRTQYEDGYRAQQALAKTQKDLAAIQAQGLITQSQASKLMQDAIKYHNGAAQAGKVHSAVLQELSTQASSAAGQLGVLGNILVKLGPAGIAIGAAFGTAALAIGTMVHEALRMAEFAGQLRDLSDTTGFTVRELQALQQAGADVGIDTEKLTGILERFTFELDSAHDSTGNLYKAITQVNPALADQLAFATESSDAFNVLVKAINEASTASQKLAIARAAAGRQGGAALVRLASQGDLDAIKRQFSDLDGITAKQAKEWDDLGDAIAKNLKNARNNLASTFSEEILTRLKSTSESIIEFSRAVKEFKFTQDLDSFFQAIMDPRLAAAASAIAKFLSGGFGIKAEVAANAKNAAVSLEDAAAAAQKLGDEMGGAGMFPEEKITGGADALSRQAQAAKEASDALELYNRNLQNIAEKSKTFIATLSGTATPAELLADKLKQLQATVAKYPDQAGAAAIATQRLNAQFADDQESKRIQLLGDLATVTDRVTEAQIKINKARQEGVTVGADLEARLKRIAELEAIAQKSGATVSALGDSATQAEKFRSEQDRLNVALEKGQISVDQYNRALRNLNPTFKAVTDAIGQVGSDLAAAFIDGKNAAEALNQSLQNVAKTAASEAIRNLLKGDLAGAAISGGIAIGSFLLSKLFGGQDDKAAQQRSQQAVEQINQAAQATDAFTQQLKALNNTATGATKAIADAEDTLNKARAQGAAAQLQIIVAYQQQNISLAQAIIGINGVNQSLDDAAKAFEEFKRRTIDDLTKSMQAAINESTGRGFINQLNDLMDQIRDAQNVGVDPNLIAEFLRTQAQAIVDSAHLTGDAFQEMLQRFPQLIGLLHEFNDGLPPIIDNLPPVTDAIKRSADEIKNAADDLQARLLGATTDTSTLEGQLAIFDLNAQRQREAEIKAGGENLALLEQVLAAERLKIIQDFQKKAVDAEKQAADDRVKAINSAASDIVNYVNSLFTGADSPLSPQARLQQAQDAYNAVLAVAQTGNIDAQNQITKFAEDLRKAAQDFYGSGTGYQTIVNTIKNQLLALPAPTLTTDPVVQALLNVQGAVQDGTQTLTTDNAEQSDLLSAIKDLNIAANTLLTTANTIATSIQSLITSTNTLVTTQNSLVTSSNSLLTSTNNLISATNTLVSSSNSILSAIQSLNSTANSTLGAINTNTAILQSSENHLNIIESNTSNISSKSNNIDSHTSHMFAPSGSVNFNLASGGFVGRGFGGAREFRLAGGGPVGTDTVPAWLTPGEFVVRREVAQANPWLPMFNAGGFVPGAGGNTWANIETLLSAIVAAVQTNTRATVGQTYSLNRESRFAARKRA